MSNDKQLFELCVIQQETSRPQDKPDRFPIARLYGPNKDGGYSVLGWLHGYRLPERLDETHAYSLVVWPVQKRADESIPKAE